MRVKTGLWVLLGSFAGMAAVSLISIYYILIHSQFFEKEAELGQKWILTYSDIETTAVATIKDFVEVDSADDLFTDNTILKNLGAFETAIDRLKELEKIER